MHRRHTRIATGALVGLSALGALTVGGVVDATTPTDPTTSVPVVTESPVTVPVTASETTSDTPQTSPADDPVELDGAIISVNGHGDVSVTPDIATIWMGVQVQAATTQEALDTLSEKANALVATLTALGIADEDIQTSGLSLWPVYGNDGTTVTGYQASNNVSVTVRELDRAGEVIDAAQGFVGEGFTLGGINFESSDPEAAMQEARVEAIENARVRAEQYAAAAGAEVGDVLQIIEQGTANVVMTRAATAMDAAEGAASMPIEPGQQEMTADVTVVFELR